MNSSSGSALAAAGFSSWKHNLSWYEGIIPAVVDGACMMPRRFRFATIGACRNGLIRVAMLFPCVNCNCLLTLVCAEVPPTYLLAFIGDRHIYELQGLPQIPIIDFNANSDSKVTFIDWLLEITLGRRRT